MKKRKRINLLHIKSDFKNRKGEIENVSANTSREFTEQIHGNKRIIKTLKPILI